MAITPEERARRRALLQAQDPEQSESDAARESEDLGITSEDGEHLAPGEALPDERSYTPK